MTPPQDRIARELQNWHDGWIVWFGRYTGSYWAMRRAASSSADVLIEGTGVDELLERMRAFEPAASAFSRSA
jgi:hypothetical protein